MRMASLDSKYEWTDIYSVSTEDGEEHLSKSVVLLGKTNVNKSRVHQ